MREKFLRLLRCPYCNEDLIVVKAIKKYKWKIARCNCSEFPILDNLIILIKDDTQLNHRIINSFFNKNEVLVMWTCLSGVRLPERLLFFLLWYLRRKFSLRLSKYTALRLFKLFSREKSWYHYLIRREDTQDFIFAFKLLKSNLKLGLMLDIGCGAGHLLEKISNQYPKNKIIGIDRSILSLFIAQLYLKNPNVYFCLTDLEQGIPIRNSIGKTAISLNSLPWIYNKRRLCDEANRVLANKGKFYIFNIFSPIGEAKKWGDGITPKNIHSYLNKFKLIKFMNYSEKNKKINEYHYNVLAVKK